MSDETWEDLVRGGLVAEHVSLKPLTTARVGGAARWLARISERDMLGRLIAAYRLDPVPVLVLGRGSNLVVADSGFDGLVVTLTGDLARIELLEDRVRAGGGTPLPTLARAAVAAGRLGLEPYVGIPGSVGGAVRQNAGGHGADTRSLLLRAEVVDLAVGDGLWLTGDELHLGYRTSSITATGVVLVADFSFEPGPRQIGEARLREITRWRRDHQPGGTRNAGSIFTNPPGDSAGRLVDSCGLKGLRVGGAVISERHANFFEAEAGASAMDIARLVTLVRRRVADDTGIVLEPEIRFVGDFGEELAWIPA